MAAPVSGHSTSDAQQLQPVNRVRGGEVTSCMTLQSKCHRNDHGSCLSADWFSGCQRLQVRVHAFGAYNQSDPRSLSF